MNDVTFILFALAACSYLFTFVVTVSEIIECRWIKTPGVKSFNSIKLESIHHQTVVAPAIAALASGLLVSISASYFYDGLRDPTHGLSFAAGLFIFAISIALLLYLLHAALSDAGDEAKLIKDPAIIAAAARELFENPGQGKITPDLLERELDLWVSYVGNYSLRLAPKGRRLKNRSLLEESLDAKGLLHTSFIACRIYFSALKVFKIRFSGPFIGLTFLILSWASLIVSIYLDAGHGFEFLTFSSISILSIGSGVVVSLLYCFARGNYARIWYKTYKPLEVAAREEIELARSAASIEAQQTTLLGKLIDPAGASGPDEILITPEKTLFAISFGGRALRISITAKNSEKIHTPEHFRNYKSK